MDVSGGIHIIQVHVKLFVTCMSEKVLLVGALNSVFFHISNGFSSKFMRSIELFAT